MSKFLTRLLCVVEVEVEADDINEVVFATDEYDCDVLNALPKKIIEVIDVIEEEEQ